MATCQTEAAVNQFACLGVAVGGFTQRAKEMTYTVTEEAGQFLS